MELMIFLFLTFSLTLFLDLLVSRRTPTIQSFNINLLEVEETGVNKLAVSWGIIRMWIPTFTVIVTSTLFHGDPSGITGPIKLSLKNVLFSLIGPLIVLFALLIYFVFAKLFGLLEENYKERLEKGLGRLSLSKTLIIAYFASITMNAFVSAGEELAWRGYMLEKLVEIGCNVIVLSFIIGVIWGLWHVPAIYLLDFSIPKGSTYKSKYTVAITYTLTVTAISLCITPLVYQTGNIFLAFTIHGAINAYWGITYMISKNNIEKTGMGIIASISWLMIGTTTLFFLMCF